MRHRSGDDKPDDEIGHIESEVGEELRRFDLAQDASRSETAAEGERVVNPPAGLIEAAHDGLLHDEDKPEFAVGRLFRKRDVEGRGDLERRS